MSSKLEIEVVILAGGLGSRLQSVIKDSPKPMAQINGRPFLAYLMDYLSKYGVSKILLSVGYKYEVIKNYFGLRYKDIDIEYIVENKPLGTGGAIKESLRGIKGNLFLVLNGDTFFDVDLRKMFEFHNASNSLITLAVKPMHNFDRYGSIILRKDRIVSFEEKTFKESGYINGGVCVINKAISGYLNEYYNRFSFEVDFLEKNTDKLNFSAFICDNYFIDIGIPGDYEKAQRELIRVINKD